MAKQTNNFQCIGFRNAAVVFDATDTTTIKDVVSAGADDSIITSVAITSTDVSGCDVHLYLHDGANDFLISTIGIPASAGNINSAPTVDAINVAWLPLSSGKRVITIENGWKLRASMGATVGGDVTISAMVQDY